MSKEQQLPRPPVEGTSQPPTELGPQATRFKGPMEGGGLRLSR